MCSSGILSGPELADQLRKAFASDPWYGPATADLLAPLTAAQAATRPQASAHTIWEIVLHMTAWQREVASRLAGGSPEPPPADWPIPPPPTEEAWKHARLELGQSLELVARNVEVLSHDNLKVLVGTTRDRALGSGVTRAAMVAGLLQHNAYHSGQIALLAKALSEQ
jgi:uncharacterized damage-inducible protein DinB